MEQTTQSDALLRIVLVNILTEFTYKSSMTGVDKSLDGQVITHLAPALVNVILDGDLSGTGFAQHLIKKHLGIP